jgi:hypothetical protein
MKPSFKDRLKIHLENELSASRMARQNTGKNAAVWWDGYHQAIETLLQNKFSTGSELEAKHKEG